MNLKLSDKIHFIGIGGASMSSLALFLADKGYSITGSDINDITYLFKMQDNIKTFKGHNAENLGDADTVIYTRAVGEDNPELIEAKKRGLKILERAELLGIIADSYSKAVAVSGTHGKTTTTSLISTIFLALDTDPTVMVGGKMQCSDSNFVLGKSDYFIYEACEYHDAFLHFHPNASVILNIELDHPDYFKSEQQLADSFASFSHNLREGGFTVINKGDKAARELIEKGRIVDPVTFGLTDDCDVYASDLSVHDGGSSFTLNFKDGRSYPAVLSVGGEHNVLNALAAFAVADKYGLDIEKAIEVARRFQTPKRRYELVKKTEKITVIDDFAHHPTELKATIKMALTGKYDTVTVIFQPHTYTRTAAFLDGFAESLKLADNVILLPIYAAREKDIYNVSSADIAELVPGAVLASDFKDAGEKAMKTVKGRTAILTVGAGDVWKVWDHLK